MSHDILSHIPAWAETMVKLPDGKRHEIRDKILGEIRSRRPKNAAKETVWLTDALENDSRYECRGFVINLTYVPLDGKHMDPEAVYCHPWGTPKLLYWDNKLKMVLIVGADTALDPENTVGFTG